MYHVYMIDCCLIQSVLSKMLWYHRFRDVKRVNEIPAADLLAQETNMFVPITFETQGALHFAMCLVAYFCGIEFENCVRQDAFVRALHGGLICMFIKLYIHWMI